MISRSKAVEIQELFSKLKRTTNWTADKHAFAALELSSTQARLLIYVAEHRGVSQTELARATNTDKALTGRALQTLIERGWLLREQSADDGRAYVLSVNAAGRKVAKQLQGIGVEIINRLCRTLNDRDVDDFRRIAGKLLVD